MSANVSVLRRREGRTLSSILQTSSAFSSPEVFWKFLASVKTSDKRPSRATRTVDLIFLWNSVARSPRVYIRRRNMTRIARFFSSSWPFHDLQYKFFILHRSCVSFLYRYKFKYARDCLCKAFVFYYKRISDIYFALLRSYGWDMFRKTLTYNVCVTWSSKNNINKKSYVLLPSSDIPKLFNIQFQYSWKCAQCVDSFSPSATCISRDKIFHFDNRREIVSHI